MPSLPPTHRETLCSSERLLGFYHHCKDLTAATNSMPQIIQTATKQGHQTSASARVCVSGEAVCIMHPDKGNKIVELLL